MLKLVIILTIYSFAVGAEDAPAAKRLKELFKDKTKIDNPFELRDPFKSPPGPKDSYSRKKGFYMSGKGQYSNIKQPAPESLSLQDIRVVGVLIGRERRAIISPKEGVKEVVILKEGMRIGQDKAELKAILPGGIVLVEKIINVYGQEEYLETVIPISR